MSSESAPSLPPVDPSHLGGNVIADDPLRIKHETFESAAGARKQLSDEFIDGCIGGSLAVGDETVGIKGYLDKVEATPNDNEIIEDPEKIASLYLATTDMLARNLKLKVGSKTGPVPADRLVLAKTAKENFLAKLHDEAGETADRIVAWNEGKTKAFPSEELEYHGFDFGGKDLLSPKVNKESEDVQSNFDIQRQLGATFIMGYSDTRVRDRMNNQETELNNRIYLNPDAFATPQIFEQVLQAANEAGLSIQLKMVQRAAEMSTAHKGRELGRAADALRGDGIVVYASKGQANEVLQLALAVAKDYPEAFVGRQTSKIPQRVAEGVAVGDEPGAAGESLTSHRAQLFEHAAAAAAKSGKSGQEAREVFRRRAAMLAKANNINIENVAFNAA